MNCIRHLAAAIALFSQGLLLSAQDWHFSQFQANPLTVSPAFAGLFNGDLRAAVHYRNQWNFAAKFNTFSATFDGALAHFQNGDYFGVGAQFLGDRAGDLDFSTYQGNLTLVYHKSLSNSESHYLSAGFAGGYARRSIVLTKIVAFDPEPGAITNPNFFTFADLSMGLNWYRAPQPNVFYYLGGAIFHVNRPDQSFLDADTDKLFMRQTLYGGFSVALSQSIFVQPSMIYMRQGPHQEINAGTSLRFWLNANQQAYEAEKSFSLGLWYRYQDALVLMSRFDYEDFNFGISYDFNISRLSPGSNGQGGPEISVVYLLHKGSGKDGNQANKLLCPSFF